jgi:hypothetical protein
VHLLGAFWSYPLRATGGEGQRVDKLIYFLLNTVTEMFTYRKVRRHHGVPKTRLPCIKPGYRQHMGALCKAPALLMAGAAEHLVCHDVHTVLSIPLKAEPHMSQPGLNRAGKPENAQAAKHIIQMLRLAKCFDPSRFRQLEDSSFQGDDAQDCNGAQADEGIIQCVPGKVLVCSKDKATLQYTMQRPSERYAACDCETGRQKRICHHQVAYLLFSSPDPVAAECLIYKMLGLRFGFLGGCTETDIAVLWEALSCQIPNPAARRIAPAACTEAPNDMAVAAKPTVGDAAEVSDIGEPPTSQVAAAHTIFGKVARDNWRTRPLQRLHRIFEDMEKTPSEVQGDLAVQIVVLRKTLHATWARWPARPSLPERSLPRSSALRSIAPAGQPCLPGSLVTD